MFKFGDVFPLEIILLFVWFPWLSGSYCWGGVGFTFLNGLPGPKFVNFEVFKYCNVVMCISTTNLIMTVTQLKSVNALRNDLFFVPSNYTLTLFFHFQRPIIYPCRPSCLKHVCQHGVIPIRINDHCLLRYR